MSTFFVIARLYGYFPMKYARISPAAKGGTVCTSPHSARHAPVRPCHTSVRQCHVPVRQCHVPVRPCHATVRPRHTSMRTCHTLVPFVPRPCVPVPRPCASMPPCPESAHFMCAPFREMQKAVPENSGTALAFVCFLPFLSVSAHAGNQPMPRSLEPIRLRSPVEPDTASRNSL